MSDVLGVGDGGDRARHAVLASSIAREGWRNSGARHEVRVMSASGGGGEPSRWKVVRGLRPLRVRRRRRRSTRKVSFEIG